MREPLRVFLASKQYSTEHRARSWWHLGSTFLVAAASATGVCLFDPLWLRVLASVLLGLVLVRLFIVYHDVLHGTILKGSLLARAIMTVYGLLVLNPPRIWERSHEHHHRNVGKMFGSSIGSFPIMTRTAWQRSTPMQRFQYAFARHPLTIATGYVTIFLFGMCIRSFAVDRRAHFDSGLAILLHAALVATLAVFAPGLLLFLVLLPMTIACALGSYLFYAQHNFPGAKIREREEWKYYDAAVESSSYFVMGPVMRWFTGNIGYHHVHHVNARIPFYRLPEAMAGIPELQSAATTSFAPWHVWQCL